MTRSPMKKQVILLSLFLFANFSSAADLTGKVSFKGTPPKKEFIKMNSDPGCLKQNSGKQVAKEDVVVNSNGTLANVFVYVKEGVKMDGVPPAPTEPVTFDQKGCMYHPHVFGIRVNQPLKILNSDPFMHNVHSLAKVPSNPKFNKGMVKMGEVYETKFTKPEIVKVKCDVHGWMIAHVGVVDHPYFSVTDSTGAFKIANLPPGDYTLEAWHENAKLGAKTAKVSVTAAGAPSPVEFTYN